MKTIIPDSLDIHHEISQTLSSSSRHLMTSDYQLTISLEFHKIPQTITSFSCAAQMLLICSRLTSGDSVSARPSSSWSSGISVSWTNVVSCPFRLLKLSLNFDQDMIPDDFFWTLHYTTVASWATESDKDMKLDDHKAANCRLMHK